MEVERQQSSYSRSCKLHSLYTKAYHYEESRHVRAVCLVQPELESALSALTRMISGIMRTLSLFLDLAASISMSLNMRMSLKLEKL